MTEVWKLSGHVCQDPKVLDALASTPGRRVYLHGAGIQLDTALNPLGAPVKLQGLRVTSPQAAQIVLDTMDAIGQELRDALQQRGVATAHVRAASKWLHAVPKTVPDGDLERVGTATHAEVDAIRRHLMAGEAPVVSPVGWDAAGPLNVNADDAAAALAISLSADAVCLVTDVPHVRRGDEALTDLSPAAAEALIAHGHAVGGMVPKLRAALSMLASGIPAVRIGTVETLLAGGGTRLHQEVTV